MKIVVIGGPTGLIGSRRSSKVVKILRRQGHEVLAASPNTGVNTITGEGLAEALTGAQVVIDVANSPSFEDAGGNGLLPAPPGRNLLAAEQAAGVAHHIALSVVGTERLQASGYFRAKLAQEEADQGLAVALDHPALDPVLPVRHRHHPVGRRRRRGSPAPALVQPVAADDVAEALADIALSAPVNGTVEIAGPEAIAWIDFAEEYLNAKEDRRAVVADPRPSISARAGRRLADAGPESAPGQDHAGRLAARQSISAD
jgi:uncharacterized protein YbjT (DUF2867 family)